MQPQPQCRILGMLALGFALSSGFAPARAEQGDWVIRLRAVNVKPNDQSGRVSSNGVPLTGSSVSVDDDTIPELDISYFVLERLALELVLGSSQHDVYGASSLASFGKLLDSRTLPPTLSLQYHFAPASLFRPYLGVGLNYTLFFDEQATGAFEAAAGGQSDVDLDDSVGFAVQVGTDIALGKKSKWIVNVDVKYVSIDTEATIVTPGPLGKLTVDVDIDPWLVGVGFGRTF